LHLTIIRGKSGSCVKVRRQGRGKGNMDFRIIPAGTDWPRFIKVFNDCTRYAPYSLKLTMELVEGFIVPFGRTVEDHACIAFNGEAAGIAHAGIHVDGMKRTGVIYLLLANDNDAAQKLLEEAEGWFREKGIRDVLAYWWYPNPYRFILHGAEVYGWAGAYAAMNGYRRMGYDIALDVVVMSREFDENAIQLPDYCGLDLRETLTSEDELVWSAEVAAFSGGKQVGRCGYMHMKALSTHFGKGIGQFNIGTDPAEHGHDVGRALLQHAHARLHERGVRKVLLATNQELFRAIKFYEKMGYRPEAVRAYSFSKKIT
jgi:ribosomal protein S18 acetylase RimI-like enzyme